MRVTFRSPCLVRSLEAPVFAFNEGRCFLARRPSYCLAHDVHARSQLCHVTHSKGKWMYINWVWDSFLENFIKPFEIREVSHTWVGMQALGTKNMLEDDTVVKKVYFFPSAVTGGSDSSGLSAANTWRWGIRNERCHGNNSFCDCEVIVTLLRHNVAPKAGSK